MILPPIRGWELRHVSDDILRLDIVDSDPAPDQGVGIETENFLSVIPLENRGDPAPDQGVGIETRLRQFRRSDPVTE